MTDTLHIAIVGSRDFPDLPRVRRAVQALAKNHPGVRVVSGGARGVDAVAEHFAVDSGLVVYSFRPRRRDDDLYEIELVEYINAGERRAPCVDGKTYKTFAQAAFARNRKIVQHSQRVIAYTIGSRGTENTISVARELGVPVTVHVAQ